MYNLHLYFLYHKFMDVYMEFWKVSDYIYVKVTTN